MASNNIKPSKYPVNPDEQSELFDQAVTAGRAGKQDELVSGTNIKTVNGNSLLGSGDITITGTGITSVGLTTGTSGADISVSNSPITSNGSITLNIPTASATIRGALSSSDWTTFNNKQTALVSGTNIKTINSTSLLGSGNITTNPRTISSVVGSNLLGTANQISASVLIPAGTIITNNSIYIRNLLTKTAGSTASTARIYINTSNSLTGATLIGTAASMTSTTYIQRFERNYFFDGTNLNVFNTSNLISTDLTAGTNSLVAFNPSVDNYLIFAVQNSTTTPDNLGHKRVIVQVYD